jgi:hypothetical protein
MQAPSNRGDWRFQLRHSIGWTLFLKLVALLALWAFFFSPAHRTDVTPDRVDSKLVLGTGPEKPDD